MHFIKYKISLVLLIAGAIFLIFTAFQEQSPALVRQQLIEEKIAERIEKYQREHRKKCKEETINKAIALVDSTLIANAKNRIDSIPKPPKPSRPERPKILKPRDSLIVKPLLLRDTLNKN